MMQHNLLQKGVEQSTRRESEEAARGMHHAGFTYKVSFYGFEDELHVYL
uniref:Uncharacterized protein n=1 Tax=Oryza punctata TaxID=4537 RepID=A0A0E0KPG4_ORYPU